MTCCHVSGCLPPHTCSPPPPLSHPAAGGKIGLIDYGQSKRLPDSYRAAFAQLVLQLEKGDDAGISAALRGVGVITERDEPALAAKLAYGMFDTRGK